MENIPLLQQVQKKFKTNKAEDALISCQNFVNKIAGNNREKLHGELLLSEILIELGRKDESLAALERGMALFSISTLPDEKLQILSTLGYRRSDLGLYQQAAESWLKVGQYSAEVGNVDHFIEALLGIGSLLEIVAEHAGALNFFNQAESLSNTSNSELILARLHFHIVSCYISLKKYDKAQKYLTFCKDNDSLETVFEFEALIHFYQARIYRKQGQVKKALQEIQKAEEIALRGIEVWTRSMIKLELGCCLIIDKKALQAAQLLCDALSNINGVGLDFVEQKLNEALSDAHAQLGQFDIALEYEKKAHKIVLNLMEKIPVGKLECEYFANLAKYKRLLTIQQTQQENEELKHQAEDQHDLVEQLQHDVCTDPLTQVYNRRWLDDELQNKKEIYGTLLIDADHFKTVNDDFSHQVGDRVLKRLATILSSEIRPVDSVSRYGGEEFVIILCSANQQQIYSLSERIRHTVEVTYWGDLLPNRPLTISVGGALKRHDESGSQVLKRADTALYKAKANGRNCCIFSKE